MKRLIIILIFCFFAVNNANAVTAFYRISSGEVYNISIDDDDFTAMVGIEDYFAILSGGTYPDGYDVLPAKIVDGTTVRNATQPEINAFVTFKAEDRADREIQQAIRYLNKHPQMKKILIALLSVLIDHQFNPSRAWMNDLKEAVTAATSLSDFKSRVAALPDWNENVTMGNLKTAVENEIQ